MLRYGEGNVWLKFHFMSMSFLDWFSLKYHFSLESNVYMKTRYYASFLLFCFWSLAVKIHVLTSLCTIINAWKVCGKPHSWKKALLTFWNYSGKPLPLPILMVFLLFFSMVCQFFLCVGKEINANWDSFKNNTISCIDLVCVLFIFQGKRDFLCFLGSNLVQKVIFIMI